MTDVKIVTSDILQEKVNALKKVCNPSCFSSTENGAAYCELHSDIDVESTRKLIRLIATGKQVVNREIKVFSLVAYIDGDGTIAGNLSGVPSLNVGLTIDNDGKYCVVVGCDSDNNDILLLSVNVGLFYGNYDEYDEKNHVISADWLNETEVSVTEIQNSAANFSFSYIDENGDELAVYDGDSIESINRAGMALSIPDDIPITVTSSQNSAATITGSGTLLNDLSDASIQLTVENIPITVPTATSSTVGGIKLFSVTDTLAATQSPIKLDSNGKAYVNVPEVDIHRYTDLDSITLPIRSIVLYIGNTTSKYTNGYFYQYWPTLFTATLTGLRWSTIGTIAETAALIQEYNKTINYLFIPGLPITLSIKPTGDPQGSEIQFTSATVFTVLQGAFSTELTLDEVNTNFGIGINSSYTSYIVGSESLYSLTIQWNAVSTSPSEWVLKNVQPVVSMSSALVYKGPCAYTDLEAVTPTALPGDFYTMTDTAHQNQEYFFNGVITEDWLDSWEYMGEVFTTPEYTEGNNIEFTTAGNNTSISALGYTYDSTWNIVFLGTNTGLPESNSTVQDLTVAGKNSEYADITDNALGSRLFLVGDGGTNPSNAIIVGGKGNLGVRSNSLYRVNTYDDTSSSLPLTITKDCARYHYIETSNNLTITVAGPAGAATQENPEYVSEIVVHIKNAGLNTIKIKAIGSTGLFGCSLINMYDSDLTSSGIDLEAGKCMELCFTFWKWRTVSVNGGISV